MGRSLLPPLLRTGTEKESEAMASPQDEWINECAARLRELVPELDEPTALELALELWEDASGVMEPAEAAEMEMRVRLQESAEAAGEGAEESDEEAGAEDEDDGEEPPPAVH